MSLATPYIVAVSIAMGAAGGGALAWWAQGNRIERLQLLSERYEAASRLGAQLVKHEAEAAKKRIDGLESDLEAAHKKREQTYVEVVKDVQVVASPTRQCLTPAVRRVLDSSAGNPTPAPSADPRVALAIPAAPAADPGGPGASERAVALWMAAALRQYSALRDQHRTLADVVRSLPCVQVID